METQTEKLGKVSITVEEGYWDPNKVYDRLTVVERAGTRTTYLSRKPVPSGVNITDRKYWIPFSNSEQTIQNVVDNEDLGVYDNVIKLKNKEHDINNYSGLGRKYLRKNIVNDINVFTQDMMPIATQEGEEDPGRNIIYIIQYDYDLNGQTIKVPSGSILKFEGGSLSNGVLEGNNTVIQAKPVKILNTDVTLSGTWIIDTAYVEWFGAVTNIEDDCSAAFSKTLNLGANKVQLMSGHYGLHTVDFNKDLILLGGNGGTVLDFNLKDISVPIPYNQVVCFPTYIIRTAFTEEEFLSSKDVDQHYMHIVAPALDDEHPAEDIVEEFELTKEMSSPYTFTYTAEHKALASVRGMKITGSCYRLDKVSYGDTTLWDVTVDTEEGFKWINGEKSNVVIPASTMENVPEGATIELTYSGLSYVSSDTNLLDHVIIKNVTFDGHEDTIETYPSSMADEHTPALIHAVHTSYVLIENCEFRNSVFNAISLTGNLSSNIISNKFYRIGTERGNTPFTGGSYNAITCKERLTSWGYSFWGTARKGSKLIVDNCDFKTIRDVVLNSGTTNTISFTNSTIYDVGGYCFEGNANDGENLYKYLESYDSLPVSIKEFRNNNIRNVHSNIFNYSDPGRVCEFIVENNSICDQGVDYSRGRGYGYSYVFNFNIGRNYVGGKVIIRGNTINGTSTEHFCYCDVETVVFENNTVDNVSLIYNSGRDPLFSYYIKTLYVLNNHFSIKNTYAAEAYAFIASRPSMRELVIKDNIFDVYYNANIIMLRRMEDGIFSANISNNKVYHKEDGISTVLLNIYVTGDAGTINSLFISNNDCDGGLIFKKYGSASSYFTINSVVIRDNVCKGALYDTGSTNTIYVKRFLEKVSNFVNDGNKASSNTLKIATVGTTETRLGLISYIDKLVKGYEFLDTDLNKLYKIKVLNKTYGYIKWVDGNGFSPVPNKGTTDNRPTGRCYRIEGTANNMTTITNYGKRVFVGFTFHNTTDGKYYIATAIDNDGVVTWTDESTLHADVPADAPRTGNAASMPSAEYVYNNLYDGYIYYLKASALDMTTAETLPLAATAKRSGEGTEEDPYVYDVQWTACSYKEPYLLLNTNNTDIRFSYFDTDLNKTIYVSSMNDFGTVTWVEEDGARAGVARSGAFANRPNSSYIYVSFQYYNTDSHCYITYGGNDKWYDANGEEVVSNEE